MQIHLNFYAALCVPSSHALSIGFDVITGVNIFDYLMDMDIEMNMSIQ